MLISSLNRPEMITLPTREERLKINEKLQRLQTIQYQKQAVAYQKREGVQSVEPQCQRQRQPLSKAQLDQLVNRLCRQTNRQYKIHQQVSDLRKSKTELSRKRMQTQRVQERLISKGVQYDRNKQEMEKAFKRQTKEKYYRQNPVITDKARSINQDPLYQRLSQISVRKQQLKQKLQEKYDPSFRPKINPYSQFINDIENFGNVQNRMEIKKKQSGERKQRLVKVLQIKNQIECTHRPAINQRSRLLAETKKKQPPQELQPSQDKSQVLTECLFIPVINHKTDQILRGKDRGGSCFERLYNNNMQNQINREYRKSVLDQRYSFQPKLKKGSMQMLSASNKLLKIQNCCVQDEQFFEQIFYSQEDLSVSRVKQARPLASDRLREAKHQLSTNAKSFQSKQPRPGEASYIYAHLY